MNKRQFLKTSGALVGSSLLPPLASGAQKGAPRTNWAGNYRYSTDRLHTPRTVAEVSNIVKSCDNLRALGTRHSFNGIADSTRNQISLQNFTQMEINRDKRTVTVGAGIPYGRLAPYLHENGFALHNLASLPHISVAGACATGTHGSGLKNGNLSTAVSELEFVTANGEIVTLSRERNPEEFHGAVVSLGAIGVVTKLALDVQPTFDASQVVYQNLPLSALKSHLKEIFASGWSVSLFTDWQNERIAQVWIKSRSDQARSAAPPEFFGAKLASRKLHPLTGHPAESCTEQMGISGPWYERLPHFRMNFTPSSGEELQSEYFVALDRAYDAILAVEKLRDRVTPHLFISELRTIAADDLWMSPSYQRSSLAIHFTWKPEWEAVRKLMPIIEEQLAPFEPRPHWGKLFGVAPSRLQARYEKLSDFRSLTKQYDPDGKFRNEFLNTNLFA